MKREMRCKKCKSTMFTIDILDSCDDCPHNGYYDDGEYHHGPLPEGKERTEASVEGACGMGPCYDCGCWLVKCQSCNMMEHVPFMCE